MSQKRILIAEDEENILDAVKLNLEIENYYVASTKNGKACLEKFKEARFDLIILDVMMPEIDGFMVGETIRLENKEVPILYLTARNTTEDRLKGLGIGDDYLAKPFHLDELILRVKNLLKRGAINDDAKQETEILILGNSSINFSTYQFIDKNSNEGKLSKREIKLLQLLHDKKGQVVSRDEILEKVWGYDVYPSTRTIDNYILAFRKYFELDPKQPKFFHSVRGVGYKLTF